MKNRKSCALQLIIPDFLRCSSKIGFTLLEILVAIAILGIAVTVVLQLFSANLRAISASDDYIAAVIKAEAKMREILDNEEISEQSYSETTDDGYRMDIFITDTLKERTENLNVSLLQIDLIMSWVKGSKARSVTLRTMKVTGKKVGSEKF
jgi:prepilin-type N-terminal cleavage/methylation domain-containing protein